MPSCPKSKVRTRLAGHTGAGPAGHFLNGMKAVAGSWTGGVRRDTTPSELPWGADSRLLRGSERKALEVEAEPGAGRWVEAARSALSARLRQGASKGKPQYRQGHTMWGDLGHGPRRRGRALHATAQNLRPNPILSAPSPSTSKGG